MPWEPEVWSIALPDPYDPDGSWIGIPENFDTEAQARGFMQRTMGGDSKGRIGTISHIEEEGWLVDLPNPENPEGPWIFVDSFETKREAVAFVKEKYFGDSNGRLDLIDVMESLDPEDPDDPREWDPRRQRRT